MLRLARIVSGRRSKFLMLAAWLVLVAALGPLAGRFEQAQKNEPASSLSPTWSPISPVCAGARRRSVKPTTSAAPK
jgi:hypothetical protein